ncbi:hypothetical protein MVES1_000715 [Malassezia vespertilionis]|uniref:Uncharacterized protein n=1 Tax=Malassezia vespertilionis TaxID=2020962 RepID=A0A2N1JGF7_9BASI|nr:uncharacterized protein MVES1_000715 [Malassezia vespertilionis]PKI85630.1 hypothetical protein MVES_000670 [Malassezia vespertilionis]WFD05385.1 hypothetical protein MVES1_000715 [Malassezia vespertilionis]
MATVQCAAVVCAGVALRLVASWSAGWGELILGRQELATAMDSAELLRESMYLLNTLKVDPKTVWSSLSVHHSPLLLLLPQKWVFDPFISALLWIVFDTCTGVALGLTARRLRSAAKHPSLYLSPTAVIACYLLNPYSIATCAAKSMSTLRTLLLAQSILFAMRGSSIALAATQALNSVLFLTPLALVPALTLLGADEYANYGSWRTQFGVARSSAWTQWCKKTVRYNVFFLLALLATSAVLSHDENWSFVRSVYGTRILLDDLAPSSGLAWYFFVQMFGHFRSFFLLVVNVHLWAYTIPVTIQYRSDPLFAVTMLFGLQCLFQNYTSVGDTAMYIALWSLPSVRLADYLRYPMVTSLLFAYSSLLMRAFHYLWLYAGSANANFYYAINLVHALGLGSLLLDSAYAWSPYNSK